MEHYSPNKIRVILKELKRKLKTDRKQQDRDLQNALNDGFQCVKK